MNGSEKFSFSAFTQLIIFQSNPNAFSTDDEVICACSSVNHLSGEESSGYRVGVYRSKILFKYTIRAYHSDMKFNWTAKVVGKLFKRIHVLFFTGLNLDFN